MRNTSRDSELEEPTNSEIHCELCDDRRWFVVAPTEDSPAAARTVVPCKCQERVWGVRSSDRIRQYSDLGPLERLTFDTVELGTRDTFSDPSSFREAYHAAQRFATDRQGWLVLSGPSGTGKTHLAAAVGNALVEAGQPVRFVSVPDLLDHLRSAFDPAVGAQYDQIFLQAIEAPLLILDDLGAQSSTAWADEKLDQIITQRYNRRLPTLVTTGFRFEELGDRLRTRLGDPYFSTVIHIKAGSRTPDSSDSGLGARLAETMTFDSFSTRGATGATTAQKRSLSEAFEAARVFAEHPSGWLYLAGPTGVGKTHLAAAIVGESIKQDREVLFRFVPDLLDDLRRSFGPAGTRSFDYTFNAVRDVDVLVLDDLGAEASTAWAEEKLYQLIVHRHDALMPTVFTSRTALETIGGAESRITSRYSEAIVSRLSDANVVAERYLSAPDFRHRGSAPRPGAPRAKSTRR
ncbi:MAG: ATP-binding protein [Chloroflexi bacterium]|nr:ATP-binding protein [Chloroflexota bacterium]